jgi:hypothetical protein
VTYETISENPGIRRFVWEHLNDVNRFIQRIKYAGGTFSGKKSFICEPEFTVVGHHCTYDGCNIEDNRLQAILNWPECKNVSHVRAFLGTAGVVRVFIKDYAKIAEPLVALTRKNAIFYWEPDQHEAMEALNKAIKDCSAIRTIDYECKSPVVLAVDTSWMAVGYYIYQVHPDTGMKHYAQFGSITLQGAERDYSQPKCELYGLKRAPEACRYYIWL